MQTQPNIYDFVISELILRTQQDQSMTSPYLTLTSSLNSLFTPINFNAPVVFSSLVNNLPYGYEVNSHTLSFPNGADVSNSDILVQSGNISVVLNDLGNTYTVEAEAVLVHSTDPTNNANITITGTLILTAVAPIYYGVKPFIVPITTANLSTIASTNNQFSFTSTDLGNLHIALPSSLPNLVSVTDHNQNIWPISDFSSIVVGGFKYYVSVSEMQFTGSYIKTFTLNYQ
jgi:hypothetical protein